MRNHKVFLGGDERRTNGMLNMKNSGGAIVDKHFPVAFQNAPNIKAELSDELSYHRQLFDGFYAR